MLAAQAADASQRCRKSQVHVTAASAFTPSETASPITARPQAYPIVLNELSPSSKAARRLTWLRAELWSMSCFASSAQRVVRRLS